MLLILYTHSDYDDIFRIQRDHVKRLNDVNPGSIVIFSNRTNPDLYDFPVYLYATQESYPSRILSCLAKVKEERGAIPYCVLCHDNNLLMTYSEPLMDAIAATMAEKGIHKVGLFAHHQEATAPVLTIAENPAIRIRKNTHFYLFSVAPAIWDVTVYEDVLRHNVNTYRELEMPATEYMRHKGYSVYNVDCYRNWNTASASTGTCLSVSTSPMTVVIA